MSSRPKRPHHLDPHDVPPRRLSDYPVRHPPGCRCQHCSPLPGPVDKPRDVIPVPATLGPFGPRSTAPFDDPTNLVLPIIRRPGFVTSIVGIAYARDATGIGPVGGQTPRHAVYIALARLNDDGSVANDAPRAVLVDRPLATGIRFFTVLSDGERSVVPPYDGGGGDPYGFVISTGSVVGQPGRLQYWWRWVPRDNRNIPLGETPG